MFFQSPRPFGQHSTSYRSMNSGVHSSSSMTSLKVPETKSGRTSVPPISFASIYEGGSYGPSEPRAPVTNINFGQAKISRESGPSGIARDVEEDRSNIVRLAKVSALDPKNHANLGSTYINHSTDSDGKSGQNLNALNIPISRNSEFQARSQSVNQQLPSWVCETDSRETKPEQTMQSVSSHYEEYYRSTISKQDNRFRSVSTVPFADHVLKQPAVVQPQQVPTFSTEHLSRQSAYEYEGSSKSRVSNSAQFNASQVSFNEQQQEQKPIISHQQVERPKNYATLHHVASPKMVTLQRRTSDPNLLHVTGRNFPENIAMFNVARGVREELEHDPKFRKKADILASRTATESAGTATFSPSSPPKEPSKQSRSLREMENFFEHNIQKFHHMLNTKKLAPVPSERPFNVEHVRSIFRVNNASHTDLSPMTSSTSMDAQSKQDNVSAPLRKPIETHETQAKVSCVNLKEGMRTSRFTSQHIIGTSQNTEPVEQEVCSSDETNRENTQAKSAAIFNKPIITQGTDKSSEMRKEITVLQQEQPILSGEVALLEKNYDDNFNTPRRLNHPFPVDGATFINGNGKTRNAAAPAGILMKDGNNIRSVNDSAIKTPKKVAFQCDNNIAVCKGNASEGSKTSTGIPPSVVQFDDAVNEPLQRLLKLSADIGGDLQIVGDKLSALFTEQRNFIWSAAGQNEPSTKELQRKLSPLIKLMEDVSNFKESKRNTPFFNHISAASEGIQALGWLTVKPTPAPFIKDMIEASMFFVNRVLKEQKDNKMHTEWAKSWSDVLNALHRYVRQVHTTGLVWNSCPGTKPPAPVTQVGSNSLSSGGAPPPPPPVLPPDLFAAVSSGANAATDKSDRAALFAEINAGEEITKRLKKVTPDMQTHKNPALRSQHKEIDVGTGSKETGSATTGGTASVRKQEDKPPKTWLSNGKQWNVEYYKNNNNVMVEVGDMKQTVYIYKCENSVIQKDFQIKGKVNSITLDSCKKTSVAFDSLLSQFEVINCQSVQIQTLGAMPTLSIQKTDGCQVYLSKSAMNAEIITSKSSEMNVLVPGGEDGDFMEFAVPEQFKTIYDGKKLKTTVSDIC